MPTRQVTTLEGPVSELLPRLGSVRAGDAAADAQRTRAGRQGGVMLGLGIVGGFLSLFLTAAYWPLGIFALLVSGLLLIGGIVSLVRWNQLKAADLDNERLALVQELLQMLAPDFSDKRPLSLSLWHGDCFQWGQVSGKRTEGTWLAKVNYSEHEDRWLSLGGRMQDGSVFKLSVAESGKRKAKPKRKYTKIQDRVQDEISLAIRVPAASYPHLERLSSTLHPDRLRTHALLELKPVQTQGTVLRLRAETGLRVRQVARYGAQDSGQEHRMTAGKIVALLAFLFAGLSYCRADADVAPAAAEAGTAAPPPPAG